MILDITEKSIYHQLHNSLESPIRSPEQPVKARGNEALVGMIFCLRNNYQQGETYHREMYHSTDSHQAGYQENLE